MLAGQDPTPSGGPGPRDLWVPADRAQSFGRDVGVGKATWRSRVRVHIQGCLCPPEGTWQFLKTFLGVAAYGRVLLASGRCRPGMLLKRLEPLLKGLRSLALK